MGEIIKGVAIGLGVVAAGVGIYNATNRVLKQYELDHAARREMLYCEIDSMKNKRH